jgi:hypothetical protein
MSRYHRYDNDNRLASAERRDHDDGPGRRVPGRRTLVSMLPPDLPAPVQAKGSLGGDNIQAIAHAGIQGASQRLPFIDAIQRSFGHHDVTGVRAQIGGAAADASDELGGVRGYASGDAVAFAEAPDLHLAAHEAAHVVQQRGGVRLSGGVGRAGDEYERHADAVADLVVRGEPAQDLLDTMAHRGPAGGPAVQMQRRRGRRSRESELEDRMRALELRLEVEGKRRRALELDAQYRAEFGRITERYEQVVHRLASGFQTGFTHFASVNAEQAQDDALRAQILALVVSVGMAAAFEPFIAPFLGRVSASMRNATEAIENPFNALVAGTAAAVATDAAGDATARGRLPPGDPAHPPTPPVSGPTGSSPTGTTGGSAPPPTSVVAYGDPFTFSSQNLEELAARRESIEDAFATRSRAMGGWTDEQWRSWDDTRQEAIYRQRLDELTRYPTVAGLRSVADIANTIERLLWSRWVQSNAFHRVFMSDTPNHTAFGFSLGGRRETRFHELGIDRTAGVQFGAIWNSPSDWQQRIYNWATAFRESLTT